MPYKTSPPPGSTWTPGGPAPPRPGQYALPRPHRLVPGPGRADLPLQQWLTKFIFPAKGAWLDGDKVYRGTLLAAAAEIIRGGITTVADGYFFEAAVRQAFSDAGLRAVVAQGVVGLPGPRCRNPTATWLWLRFFWTPGRITRTGSPPRSSATPPLYLWTRDPAKGQGLDPGAGGAVFSPPGGNPGGSGRPQGAAPAGPRAPTLTIWACWMS